MILPNLTGSPFSPLPHTCFSRFGSIFSSRSSVQKLTSVGFAVVEKILWGGFVGVTFLSSLLVPCLICTAGPVRDDVWLTGVVADLWMGSAPVSKLKHHSIKNWCHDGAMSALFGFKRWSVWMQPPPANGTGNHISWSRGCTECMVISFNKKSTCRKRGHFSKPHHLYSKRNDTIFCILYLWNII